MTCPIIRYHPAVVAQKAATLQVLSDGRFILGLGSGENLNEHITGEGWPPIDQRQDMLVEAATIIRELQSGELTTWEGDYFRVDSARLWDAADGGVPIAIAVSGEKSVARFAPLADHLVAVEPDAELIKAWDEEKGDTKSRKIGQLPSAGTRIATPPSSGLMISSAGSPAAGRSTPTCRRRPGSRAASQFVRPEDIADTIPCGPDLDAIVEAVKPYWRPGSPTSPWSRSATGAVGVPREGRRAAAGEAPRPRLTPHPPLVRSPPTYRWGRTGQVGGEVSSAQAVVQ